MHASELHPLFFIAIGVLTGLLSALIVFPLWFAAGIIFAFASLLLPNPSTKRHLIVPSISFFVVCYVFILSSSVFFSVADHFGVTSCSISWWGTFGGLVTSGAIGGLLTTRAYLRSSRDIVWGGLLGAFLGLSGLWGIPNFANNFSLLGDNDSLSSPFNATAPLFVCWQAGMLGFYCWRLRRIEATKEK